ncbi:S1C family serine protease [Ornithinimicrobium cryptoxanthini]|uniref:S1C family serine protease n=1 Tax=Ornithinimicrobium cryptoxanthini TaxID=2934161 RepID=A0ABY4YL47_9MICO|nr:S1C family serine protease [Ornithinimicrobium cryptoxanthini]USQ77286.1 S1C family serine protease [Ornithinimicrobium cryptoxanthini]
MTRTRVVLSAAIPLLALTVTACGTGETPTVETVTVSADQAPATAAPAAPADSGVSTASPADAGSLITTHLEAQPAVIQIQAAGGMRHPEFGNYVGGGSGSGFLIGSDGLAVTNNHVVTGAATLEVFIGGDTTRSYNARVVGASECNDLALIDISEPEPLPYLGWSQEPISVGQEIYVAGFPLGDPEYTLTRGIVSKARAASEELTWASVDHSLEHDAAAHPGNSGGPLLNTSGQVTGIHFSGYLPEDMVRQQYAIDHTLAQEVVSHLQDGDYESLGVNAMPVYDASLDVTGLWVSGVKAGSPAARAKVVPGDIITHLNGLPMAPTGTMAEYCDVLRTSGEGTPVSIEVLRWDTGEVLRGELNNPIQEDAAMVPVMSFVEEIGDEVAAGSGESAEAYTYETVVDDTDSILVEVPTEWSDRVTAVSVDTGEPFIQAAPSIERLNTTWTEPGLIYTVTDTTEDLEGLIERMDFAADCADDGQSDYTDGLYTGYYHRYSDCGGSGNQVVVLAATPNDGSFTALLLLQMMHERDVLALDHAFATFNYYTD